MCVSGKLFKWGDYSMAQQRQSRSPCLQTRNTNVNYENCFKLSVTFNKRELKLFDWIIDVKKVHYKNKKTLTRVFMKKHV